MNAQPLLEVRRLEVAYGGIKAVRGLDLQVGRGELVCLIGANGAGKSTTLRAICGLAPLAGGDILYDGASIAGLPSYMLVRRGLVMVPEGRGIFGQLTIEENLAMGGYSRRDTEGVRQDAEEVFKLFPRLAERRKQSAGTLSGGEQQMLAMARALCVEPDVLLLDEPTEGLMPSMIGKIRETVTALRGQGVSIVLVEQRVDAVLPIADRVAFVENGRNRETVPVETLRADPSAVKRYVGVG